MAVPNVCCGGLGASNFHFYSSLRLAVGTGIYEQGKAD